MVGLTDPMVHNPTRDLWVGIAGSPALVGLVDFLVLFGELAIGAALMLGLATRLAGALGALMMLLFWIASWDFQYGIVNQQFVYMVLSGFLAYASAGKVAGLDGVLEKTRLVQDRPALRLLLG
jgi:thiosulfate dehydrogenase [quinone] large subunit